MNHLTPTHLSPNRFGALLKPAFLSLVILGWAAPPAPAVPCDAAGSGTCRYVDATRGNDANTGTSAQPFRTLQRAADAVNAGDVVVVRDGVYLGGKNILDISHSGSASHWIVFRAEHRWGAVLDGRDNGSETGIEISGNFVRVEGFEVRGTSRYGIEAYRGSHVVVARNHVHHIGRLCTDTSGGRVGINAYVPHMVIEQNVVHDVGRYADGENGCRTRNAYWQNHDHGVYHGEGDDLVIRNNVFYDLRRGWAIQRYSGHGTAVDGLTIVHNTFVGANPHKVGQIIIATATTRLVIANNVFFEPNAAGVLFDAWRLSGMVANNLTCGGAVSRGASGAVVFAANFGGDPLFVDPGAHDFRLRAGSPALDRGLDLPEVRDDLDGIARPQGGGSDLGAFERR